MIENKVIKLFKTREQITVKYFLKLNTNFSKSILDCISYKISMFYRLMYFSLSNNQHINYLCKENESNFEIKAERWELTVTTIL